VTTRALYALDRVTHKSIKHMKKDPFELYLPLLFIYAVDIHTEI